MCSRIGLNVGRKIVERLHIIKIGLGVARTQRGNRLPLLLRSTHDFVVNVGDVACINNVGVLRLQQPIQQVEHNSWSRITNMYPVVNGGTAYVHGDSIGVDGREKCLFTKACVVKR